MAEPAEAWVENVQNFVPEDERRHLRMLEAILFASAEPLSHRGDRPQDAGGQSTSKRSCASCRPRMRGGASTCGAATTAGRSARRRTSPSS